MKSIKLVVEFIAASCIVALALLMATSCREAEAAELAYLTAQRVEGDKRLCYYSYRGGEILLVSEVKHLCPITINPSSLLVML